MTKRVKINKPAASAYNLLNNTIKLNQDVLLFNLSPDVKQFKLETSLSPHSLHGLMLTSKKAYHLFKDSFRFKQLLQYVAFGEETNALNIIKNNPDFLLQCGMVKDLSGRIIKDVSPITLAYGADDNLMLSKMLGYLDSNTKRQAFKQINAKFPDDKTENKPYDFSLLLINLVSGNKNTIDAAFEKFRADFKPGVNTKNKHFYLNHLIAAYAIYTDRHIHWNSATASLFWCKVIGYLQHMLPANYAQAYCQGLSTAVENTHSLQRELKLKNNIDFFNPQLGVDYAVSSLRDRGNTLDTGQWAWTAAYTARLLTEYQRKKHQALYELLENCRLPKNSVPHCSH